MSAVLAANAQPTGMIEQPAPMPFASPNTSLMLDSQTMDSMLRFAEQMANGKVTIPEHLRKNPSDCLAVVMQSIQWRMNPFAVAQKTHVTKSGALGYEAQLINAVIITLAPIKYRPKFTFQGDWSKILGKVKEAVGGGGGKYYVADWDKALEEGLGVICETTLVGEDTPREMDLLLKQCWPRFSTQWATDPKQQITFAAVRKWGRRYTPDVMLGVYTPEELDNVEAPPPYREMGNVDEVEQPSGRAGAVSDLLNGRKPEPTKPVPAKLDAVLQAIKDAKTADDMDAAGILATQIENEADKDIARDAYNARIKQLKKDAADAKAAAAKAGAAPPAGDKPALTFAEVADEIPKAMTMEQADYQRSRIKEVADPDQRAELTALLDGRVADIQAGK